MRGAVEGKLEATRGATAPVPHAIAAFGEALSRAYGPSARVELHEGLTSRAERELTFGVIAESGEAAVFGFDKAGAALLLTSLLRAGRLERDAVSRRPLALEQALGSALARDVGWALGVAVRHDAEALTRRFAHRAELSVLVADELARVALSVSLPEEPLLGSSLLRLPLIVAVSAVPRAELSELAVGDLWLPESGWLLAPEALARQGSLEGRALLATPSGVEAVWVVPSASGAVVSGPRVALDALCGLARSKPGRAEPAALEPRDEDFALVHVEVGHAEIGLARAAALRAGSQLPLVRTSPAWLCVDGRRLARGAFETTEHGYGLRIQELER